MSYALSWTDNFSGLGGSSTGVSQVAGNHVVIAANHWQLACEIHNLNHPNTDHAAVDLHKEDPAFFPSTDAMWASPECTKWSPASGAHLPAIEEGLFEDPLSSDAAQRSRLLMFDVLRFAEHHRYRYMVIENVVDIATLAKYRVAWDEWQRRLRGLGYRYEVVSLNAMHAQLLGPGAPQSRDRIYIVCWREGERAPDVQRVVSPAAYCPRCDQMVEAVQSWKNGRKVGRYRQTYLYVHGQCGQVVEPAVLPAAVAIDWSIRGERVGDRGRPLSDKTRLRIAAGIARYWGTPMQLEAAGNTYDAAAPSHPQHGDPNAYYRTWAVSEVMRTLSTDATKALAVPSGGTWNEDALPIDLPHRTLTARESYGMACTPFVAELRGGGSDARPITDPAATFTAGGNHHALVTTNNWRNRPRPASEPMPTMTTASGGGSALVTRHYGIPGGHPARHTTPVAEELRTLTGTGGNMSLTVDPGALVHRMNTGGPEMTTPAFEELRTLTTKGHQALLQAGTPSGKPRVTPAGMKAALELVDDVLFRMFRPHEVAAGQAFPPDYRYDATNPATGRPPTNADLVKGAGNAVAPPCARDIGAVIFEAATGQTAVTA